MPTCTVPARLRRRSTRLRAAVGVLALGAALAAAVTVLPGAHAAINPLERGPDPTLAILEAAAGPFATAQATVAPTPGIGFGGGTIHYPTDTAQGTFGGVAIAPGFLAPGSTLSWLAARIASHGFVVINIDTLKRGDDPVDRGRQLLAALDHLTSDSAVRRHVDPTRLAVLGHSMGGGGAIEAAATRPTLRAAVPLTPWHRTKSWPTVRVPTLIVGAELDTTADVDVHAEPLYQSMSAALDRAYLELNDADHRVPVTTNTPIGVFGVSWLKRFVDDDVRYDRFLCPGPTVGPVVSEYRDTCPHG